MKGLKVINAWARAGGKVIAKNAHPLRQIMQEARCVGSNKRISSEKILWQAVAAMVCSLGHTALPLEEKSQTTGDGSYSKRGCD